MMKNSNKIKKVLLILFVCLTFFMALFYELENDYFWHIMSGEYMFKNWNINT